MTVHSNQYKNDVDLRVDAIRLPVSELANPRLRDLLDVWRGERQDGALPRKAAFRPERMRSILGQVSVVDVTPEGSFWIRLAGTEIEDLWDATFHGRSVNEIEPPLHRELVRTHYREVAETCEPTYYRLDHQIRGCSAYMERLILPLTDDPPRVTSLLVASDWQPELRVLLRLARK